MEFNWLAILGSLGSVGSVIAAVSAIRNNREVLRLYREKDKFGKYDRLYGPFFHETPDKNYIYLTFTLFNERKKLLIKNIKVSIFFPGDQRWIDCKLLTEPPPNTGQLRTPPPFPGGYFELGKLNQRELLDKSAKDCFLALECEGFPIADPEGNVENIMEDEFTYYPNLDLKIEIETSLGKKFTFILPLWTRDPSTLDRNQVVEH